MIFMKHETIDITGHPAHISSFEGSERAFDRVGGSSETVEQINFNGVLMDK